MKTSNAMFDEAFLFFCSRPVCFRRALLNMVKLAVTSELSHAQLRRECINPVIISINGRIQDGII
jgi:hypothetical protein